MHMTMRVTDSDALRPMGTTGYYHSPHLETLLEDALSLEAVIAGHMDSRYPEALMERMIRVQAQARVMPALVGSPVDSEDIR